MKDLDYWQEYVAQQEAIQEQSARQVQSMLDESGMSLARVEELSKLDLGAIDPALIQELEMASGVKIASVPSSKPEANASNFLQRTRALAV